jgi:hypothetical protein
MKDYVERYVYAVIKRLPEASRQDVKVELNSLIYNMLSENPTEEEIEDVLISLGSPRALASNYQEEKRFLISPPYIHDYLSTLKIVGIIILLLQIFTGTIESIINLEATTLIGMVGEVFNNILGGLFGDLAIGFFLVTLFFWGYEYGVSKGEVQWLIKDLPEVPTQLKRRINRFETSVELIFYVVFYIVVFNLFTTYLEDLAVTSAVGTIIPIFNASIVSLFIPFFIAIAILGFSVILVKLYIGEWLYGVTAIHSVYEIASTVAIVLFIQNRNVLDPNIFRLIADSMGMNLDILIHNVNNGINIVSVIMIIIVLVELGFTWNKTIKGYRNQ